MKKSIIASMFAGIIISTAGMAEAACDIWFIVQGGKNMPVNVLFQRVMEEQVKKVVKDMGNKGLDRLKAVTKT